MLSVLDPARISAHTSALSAAIVGRGDAYFEALNRLQTRFPLALNSPERPLLVFELRPPTQAFLDRVLMEAGLSRIAASAFPPEERGAVREQLARAFELLERYHPALPSSVRRLIATLLLLDVDRCESGSSSDALGIVWLSPRLGWTAERYAESICHETVHQALFLEDMICPLFDFKDGEPLITSSIRREPRPYSSSFHAAVVAGALVELYTALGLESDTARFADGLAGSVAEFREAPLHLTARGRQILEELEDRFGGKHAVSAAH